MSPRPRPDFVQVRLSEAGLQFANGAPLRIHTAHLRYAFDGATPVEVLKFAEWPLLSRECDPNGKPMFELAVPAPTEVHTPEAEEA